MITKPNPHRWFIISAVMLSTVMEILDTTIVNVSLPHMMGSLSADRDQISWVLTSYIVAAGMLMPLTGFLINRFGSKHLLLINVIGFMFASALCGIATSITEMVIFRILQGVFGACLVPLAQYILRDSFPPEEQPKMMAIWGIGVMAAPIMGPTLGGFITDTFNWRWVFYINVPICIINIFLIMGYIKQSTVTKIAIDWYGMILLLTCIGALQLFLDRGQVDDWFSSATICWLFTIFAGTLILFINHCLKAKNCIINIRVFQDRNFLFGTLMMSFFAASFLAGLALLPEMLEMLFGYNSNLTGITMAPRGLASGLMMALSSRLMLHMDTRWLIAAGLAVAVVTTWIMGGMTLATSMNYITFLGFIQGLGIGLFFMPLSVNVYATLAKNNIAEASGIFSFGRNLGSAMGISLLTTYLERDMQKNWNLLGGHINAANANLTRWLQMNHLNSNDPHTIAQLTATLSRQADFLAYMHTYKIAAVILFAALLFVLLLKPNSKKMFAAAEA